jgi:predicted Holliday junction resolvase-like endonuclease
MEYFLIIIAFLVIINLTAKVNKLEDRIKGMQYSLDQVTKQAGLPENPVNDELRELIKEGKDVKAVKKQEKL